MIFPSLERLINELTMEKSSKNWLLGCGIGCGAIVVILVILIVSGFIFIRNIVYKFEESDDMAKALKDLYGEAEDYRPDPDGSIRGDRVEAFLSVREMIKEIRERLDRSIQILDEARGGVEDRIEVRTPGQGLRVFKTAFGLIPQIGEFFARRSQALLDLRMGLGEYCYIYSLVYYSWLGKSPGDGPDFQLVQKDRTWDLEEWEKGGYREEREQMRAEKINRLFLSVLKSQRDELAEHSLTPAMQMWMRILEAEITALEEDERRLPWQDGLPDVIEKSLRPFRSRLESSYSPMSNSLELAQD